MNLDGRAAKVLKGAGYSLFFIGSLLFFFVATFPDEAAKDWAQVQGSNFLGTPVQIDKAELTGLIGVNAEGIILRLKPIDEKKPSAEGADGKKKPSPPPRLIEIDRLMIESSPFALLFGDSIEFTFNGEVQGGEISDGLIALDTESQSKRMRIGSIENVQLGAERFLLGIVGLDLQGVLTGAFEVSLGQSASHIQNGEIDVTLNGAQIIKPSFKHKTMGLIGLTDTELGDLRIRAVVKPLKELPGVGKRRNRKSKDGLVIHFEELSSDSPELAFKSEAKSAIHFDPARSIGDATLDLHFAVFVKNAYLEKEGENAEGAIGKHNKIISQAARMRLIPKLARVYRKGVFGVMCTGKLSKPDCDFKRTSLKFDKEATREKKPSNTSERARKKRAERRSSSATNRRASSRSTDTSSTARRAAPTPPRSVNRKDSKTSVSGRSPRASTLPSSRVESPIRRLEADSRKTIPSAARNLSNTVRRTPPPPSLREPVLDNEGDGGEAASEEEEEEGDDEDNEEEEEEEDSEDEEEDEEEEEEEEEE